MTSASEYMTVMNMDRDLITTVSQEFVLQFYTIMNKHPGSLHRFYKEESTLIRDDIYAQGQQDIHKFYMNLELTNCKAVVLSLDAVRAHHKSILIQVTGEIANNGSDLRRFMQSFVLVEQDLGNFYVLNDIFRYQDQTFKAEDIEEQNFVEEEKKEEIRVDACASTWSDVKDIQVQRTPLISESEERNEEFVEYRNVEDKEEVPEDDVEALPEKLEEFSVKERSWAAVINPMSSRPAKPTAPVAPQPQLTKKQPQTVNDNFEKRRPRYNGAPKPQNALNYPDELQLFVGNLPQSMTEDELKDFFSSTYGPVKDVRIQKSRSANDGKPLPNFGFLVFESNEIVAEILKSKPIFYCSHRLNVEQKMGNSRAAQKPSRR